LERTVLDSLPERLDSVGLLPAMMLALIAPIDLQMA